MFLSYKLYLLISRISSTCRLPHQVSPPPLPFSPPVRNTYSLDIPFEPLDYEMDWDEYGRARQDISSYFLKLDEFGKSEMDYFVETKMDFGKDQELPICPPPAPKPTQTRTTKSTTFSKKWVPTKPTRPVSRPLNKGVKSMGRTVVPKQRFVREEMKDEVAQLEREELDLLRKNDDFGMTFDLEL